MFNKLARSDFSVFSHILKVSGLRNVNTGLERGFGSRKSVNLVTSLCFHTRKAKGRYSDILVCCWRIHLIVLQWLLVGVPLLVVLLQLPQQVFINE